MLAEAGGSQIPHDRLLTSENPVRATTPKQSLSAKRCPTPSHGLRQTQVLAHATNDRYRVGSVAPSNQATAGTGARLSPPDALAIVSYLISLRTHPAADAGGQVMPLTGRRDRRRSGNSSHDDVW
jgi:hypothetical protein